MHFKEAVQTRRSSHYYDTTKKITDQQLKEIFELVKLSPSGYNLQPWEFIVVRDQTNKDKLKECAYGQQQVGEAGAMIIVLGNSNPAAHAKEVFGDWVRKGYFDVANAEQTTNTVESWNKKPRTWRDVWTTRSTALACMTLMLVAKDMGIGTGAMEGFEPEKVMKAFGIPEQYTPVMLISMGYERKPQPTRLDRRPFE